MCARYTVGGGNTPKEWAMKRKEEEEEEHYDLSHDPRSKDVKMTSRGNEGAPVSLLFMYNRTQGSTEPKYVVANYVYIYIYIYAFSRRFYPKRLTLHSSYSFYILSGLENICYIAMVCVTRLPM